MIACAETAILVVLTLSVLALVLVNRSIVRGLMSLIVLLEQRER